jgi:hypothetical protein
VFEVGPFKGFDVQNVKVVESFSLVIDTTVTSENVDFSGSFFWLIEGSGVVCSWFWSTDL